MPNSEQTLRTVLRDSAHSEREPTEQEPFDPLVTVHRRIEALASDLASNTQATEANTASIGRLEGSVGDIKKNTDSIVEFFQAAKGAFTVLGWFGKIAKWVTAIAAACAVLWAGWHNMPKP